MHLVKLSVGTQSLDGLRLWQSQKRVQTAQGYPFHITRMWPKKETELLSGGSIYWIVQGAFLCRQALLGFEEVFGHEGKRHCKIIMDKDLVPVSPLKKRPFQGWRYLKPEDAPPDLDKSGAPNEDNLPQDLSALLDDIGVR